MISIIIPTYNKIKELRKCLRSLEKQSFEDFEVIVVDDGSNVVVGDIKTKLNISFYRMENSGAPAARNFGFNKSRGELILFCDDDMELRKDCLAKMKQVLDEDKSLDFVYSDFRYGWKKFQFWEFDVDKLKKNNYINTCSMVRREAVVEWDEGLSKFQDWDFWLTVVENGGRGGYINEMLFSASIIRGRISFWLPKFFYKLSIFKKISRVEEYSRLKKIVLDKHKNR